MSFGDVLTDIITRRLLHSNVAEKEDHVGHSHGGGHDHEETHGEHSEDSRSLRIAAIFIIMFASFLGFVIPVIYTKLRRAKFSLESRALMVGKAFSAGVVVATGLVHMYPQAIFSFGSTNLADNPWHKFPWAGGMTTLAALLTHMFDFFATVHIQRKHAMRDDEASIVALKQAVGGKISKHQGKTSGEGKSEIVLNCSEECGPDDWEVVTRNVVVAEVLEYGIASHSVLIGISLGVLTELSEAKPLLIALVFHQFFEGIALGGCTVQARFRNLSIVIMALFFCLSTPSGILIGILISRSYEENSTAALLTLGFSDSMSAGILLYNGLVSLIANDFFSKRMRSDLRLQIMSYVALFAGAGAMSVIGIWA